MYVLLVKLGSKVKLVGIRTELLNQPGTEEKFNLAYRKNR